MSCEKCCYRKNDLRLSLSWSWNKLEIASETNYVQDQIKVPFFIGFIIHHDLYVTESGADENYIWTACGQIKIQRLRIFNLQYLPVKIIYQVSFSTKGYQANTSFCWRNRKFPGRPFNKVKKPFKISFSILLHACWGLDNKSQIHTCVANWNKKLREISRRPQVVQCCITTER